MKAVPRALVGNALLFWGWRMDQLHLALPAALIIEFAPLLRLRFELTLQQIGRLADLSVLAFAVVLYAAYGQSRNLLAVTPVALRWLPGIFLPLLLTQVFGCIERIDARVFFVLTRREALAHRDAAAPLTQEGAFPTIHLGWPYFIVCLIAAGFAGPAGLHYYAGCLLLMTWALWSSKASRAPRLLWVALVIAAASAGFLGHHLLSSAQEALSRQGLEWWWRWSGGVKLLARHTQIGTLREIQLDDGIHVRVRSAQGFAPPLRLRDGVFNSLLTSYSWVANADADRLEPQADGSFLVAYGAACDGDYEISCELDNGEGDLPLPPGVLRIQNLKAPFLLHPTIGGVSVSKGPALVRMRVSAGNDDDADAFPTEEDLHVPALHRAVAARAVSRLAMSRQPPPDRPALLARYFKEFRYSLEPLEIPENETPLEEFLEHARTGHCEYFATAAVLLLRQSGVPARYVTGYVVREWSKLEGCWVARGRDAHAWAQAWIGERWVTVDVTPSGPPPPSPFLRAARDYLSFLAHRFNAWRFAGGGDRLSESAPWLIAVLALLLGWRVLKARRVRTAAAIQRAPRADLEAASPLDPIEAHLASLGWGRRPGETMLAWTRRLEATPPAASAARGLAPLAETYYALNYDPDAEREVLRKALGEGARAWMADAHKT